MISSLQAGFVPEYGQKLTALDRSWVIGNFREGAATVAKNVELRFLAPLLEILWCVCVGGWGLKREEWGFLHQTGVSWRFQSNTSH